MTLYTVERAHYLGGTSYKAWSLVSLHLSAELAKAERNEQIAREAAEDRVSRSTMKRMWRVMAIEVRP